LIIAVHPRRLHAELPGGLVHRIAHAGAG
jgi:hypothetical protein